MTQQASHVSPGVGQVTSAYRRVVNLGAHLVGGAGFAFGAVTALAKRRQENSSGDSNGDRESHREDRLAARRSDPAADDGPDRREQRQDRRDAQQDDDRRDHRARDESVDHEQRDGKQNTNTNSNTNTDDTADDTDDDDGNGRGNAGSGFFDSPLARKTQRRANDFDDNQDTDDEPDDDTLTGNTSTNGQQAFETNSVSFSNGPDGLHVVTDSIDYSAPLPPTPTPFPTLTLPERDRLDVFGDRALAAPTAVPSDNGATDGAALPPATDSGTNESTVLLPTPVPPTDDTSGGDNTSDFLS